MARKPDIEYINKYYVHGSEARVLEFKTARRTPKTTLPEPIQEKKRSIQVDPVALFGVMVSVIMLVVMTAGLLSYRSTCLEHQAMTEYTQELRNENILLRHNYRNSYDLDAVRETARALGMVEVSQANIVPLEAQPYEPEPENTWWDDLKWQLSMLFANA